MGCGIFRRRGLAGGSRSQRVCRVLSPLFSVSCLWEILSFHRSLLPQCPVSPEAENQQSQTEPKRSRSPSSCRLGYRNRKPDQHSQCFSISSLSSCCAKITKAVDDGSQFRVVSHHTGKPEAGAFEGWVPEGSHSGSSICGEDVERDGCCTQLT